MALVATLPSLCHYVLGVKCKLCSCSTCKVPFSLPQPSVGFPKFQAKETPFKTFERWTVLVEKRHITGQITLSQRSSHERGPLLKREKKRGRQKEADGSGSLSFIQAVICVTQVMTHAGDAGKACTGVCSGFHGNRCRRVLVA